MKKISIIVPVYNVEFYLPRCLDSLVNQTLKDIEIILINDGSTDNSENIIKEYMKKYSNIVFISEKNQGISVARNNGIKKATGEYIGFVDSDDFVELDMFEKMYNSINEQDADIAICNYKKYYSKNEKIIDINITNNVKVDNFWDDVSLINSIDYSPWNKIYKRSLFKNITFPEGTKYEDLSTILKTFFNSNKICKVEDALYFYRINDNGETLTVNKKVNDILLILEDIIEYLIANNKFNAIKKELKKLCINKLFYYLINSYCLNDEEYIKQFRNDIILLLNKYFYPWKFNFILKYDFSIKSKIVLANDVLFNYYIKNKFKNN